MNSTLVLPCRAVKRLLLCITTFATLSAVAHSFEPDVIIDDDDDSVEFIGDWVVDPETTNAFLGGARMLANPAMNGQQAIFKTKLPKTGPWRVFIWHNGRTGFMEEFWPAVWWWSPLMDNFRATYAKVDQRTNAGQWHLLGTFWFDEAHEAQVEATRGTEGQMSADAVRFSFVMPETVVDSSDSQGVKLLNQNGTISSASWQLTNESSGNEMNLRRSVTVDARVELTPVLPTSGEYELSMWLPSKDGPWVIPNNIAADTVTVEVHSRNGVTTHEVEMPETGAHEGAWVQIGDETFLFDATPVGQAGGPAKVVIKGPEEAGICVPVDAVRWTRVGAFSILQDDDDEWAYSHYHTQWLQGLKFGVYYSTYWTTQQGVDRQSRRYLYNHLLPFGNWERRSTTASDFGSYTPSLPEMGQYDVYMWYSWGNANSTNTKVTIQTATGVVVKSVDQMQNTGKWAHLGRYILKENVVGQAPQTSILVESMNNPGSTTSKGDAFLYVRNNEEIDADGDGLVDWNETLLGTSTSTADLNADGKPDGWDTDGDGLSDYEELRWNAEHPEMQLSATVADSDGDGILDGVEVGAMTPPVTPVASGKRYALSSTSAATAPAGTDVKLLTSSEVTALVDKIQAGQPDEIAICVTQLRCEQPALVQDAVTLLTSAIQPRLIAHLVPDLLPPTNDPDGEQSDSLSDSETPEEIVEGLNDTPEITEEVVTEGTVAAPIASAVVMLAQLQACLTVPADVRTWASQLLSTVDETTPPALLAFVQANADALTRSEFANLQLPQ